jgi:hypothetical protein
MTDTAFLVYESATGRILRGGQCRSPADDGGANLAAQASAGESVIESPFYFGDSRYVLSGTVVSRPANSISASASGLVITVSGVPVGATVTVRGRAYQDIVQDDPSGSMALTMPVSGTYQIGCDPFPTAPFVQEFTL